MAFSPRCSSTTEESLLGSTDELQGNTNKVYSEVLRLWDIVLNETELEATVQKIVTSHQQGKTSLIQVYESLQSCFFCFIYFVINLSDY